MDAALDNSSQMPERNNSETEAQKAVVDLLAQEEVRALLAEQNIPTEESLIQTAREQNGPKGIGDGTDFSGSLSNNLQAELNASPEFTGLDIADRHKVIEILENMKKLSERDGQTLGLESQFMEALSTERNGQSVLLDRDSEGRTTLDNLRDMTRGAMHSDLAGHEAELLRDVLAEITTTKTNQGMTASCTVTSMERMLVHDNPAEYTRLMSGLAKEGRVALQNGQNIYLDSSVIAQDPIHTKSDMPHRSLAGRTLQPALMNYGAGLNGLQYDSSTDKSVGVIDGVSVEVSGLLKPDYERVMEALTGRAHTRYDATSTSATMLTEAISEELAHSSGVLAELNFTRDGVLANLLNFGKKDAHSLHAVLITKVTDDYVEFFNPWGSKGDAAGTHYGNPPRTVVNQGDSIERMTREEFEKRLLSATIADSGATFGATSGAPTIYDCVEEYKRNGGSLDVTLPVEVHSPQPEVKEIIGSEPIGQLQDTGEINNPVEALSEANKILEEASTDSVHAGAYAYHQNMLKKLDTE